MQDKLIWTYTAFPNALSSDVQSFAALQMVDGLISTNAAFKNKD